MLTLGIDSSAVSASAAVVNDGKLISESFINVGLTHSETLMPLIDNALKTCGKTVSDLDLIAVTHGPGSFTGIRIGVACVKGLAAANDTPCLGVSALEVIAYPLNGRDCIALACMDARCNQVYTAAFDCRDGLKRITDDAALPIADLKNIIQNSEREFVLIGDGAEVAAKQLGEYKNVKLAPPQIRFQRASSLCFIAEDRILNTSQSPLAALFVNPVYLRKPQAERELIKRKNLTEENS